MGLLDHTKMWQFTVRADPRDCAQSFAESLSSNNGVTLLGSRWSLHDNAGSHSLPRVIARYEGRTGVISRSSTSEAKGAAESELTFTVTGYDSRSGVSTCTLHLTVAAKTMIFFTADARYLRAAMQRVAAGLRALDARLEFSKR